MYIFLDIDGTILDDRHEISDLTRKAILKYMNHIFVLVSARKPSSIKVIKHSLGINDPIIVCYNGALILEDNQVIYENCIAPKIVLQIYILSIKYDLEISIYSEDVWHVERESARVKKESEIIGESPIVRRIDKNMLYKMKTHKILLLGFQKNIERLRNEVLQKLKVQIANSKEGYCEITARGVTKEQALYFLKEYMHFDIDYTMAIGDGENDIGLLKNVKIGVAMGNSPMSVKQQADYVTESNNSNGVVIALDRWLDECDVYNWRKIY